MPQWAWDALLGASAATFLVGVRYLLNGARTRGAVALVAAVTTVVIAVPRTFGDRASDECSLSDDPAGQALGPALEQLEIKEQVLGQMCAGVDLLVLVRQGVRRSSPQLMLEYARLQARNLMMTTDPSVCSEYLAGSAAGIASGTAARKVLESMPHEDALVFAKIVQAQIEGRPQLALSADERRAAVKLAERIDPPAEMRRFSQLKEPERICAALRDDWAQIQQLPERDQRLLMQHYYEADPRYA